MIFLIKASQLIFSLSILVVLHELGHFIPAKLFKTRVEKFYLFFDPWFSLIKKKVGNTEYGVGWLPLGGYVKISGMIDESMDKGQMQKKPEPWEFRAKPAWQRLIIMLGGVTVNLFLAIFIYSMTLYWYGEEYLPNKNLTDGVWCVDPLVTDLGFQNGDKIVSVDNKPVIRFSSIVESLLEAKSVTIEREGRYLDLSVPNNFIERLIESNPSMLFYPRIPVIVADIVSGSNAEKGGLQKGDKLLAVEEEEVVYFDMLKPILSDFSGSRVSVLVNRNGNKKTLFVDVSKEGKLGFAPAMLGLSELSKLGYYTLNEEKYGFFAAFPAGYKKAISKLNSYMAQAKLILNPKTGAYKGLGGFGAIGNLFPPKWDWEVFWNLTAFLSIILAFMNILPIPALDGGHVMFLLYEMVVGRPAPEKVMEYAQIIGMVLLLGLVLYANGNDIMRLF